MKLKYFVTASVAALLFTPLAAQAAPTYWSLFNTEGESSASAIYVTYATLADMLTDSNRTGEFVPDNTGLASSNVVGSGSDGTSYWSLFNIEGESSASAIYVTYATLADMLTDSNRTGEFVPDNTGLASSNVVGSGSDGTSYWSLFNIEGESSASAIYVTYATLADMLTDSNRTGEFVPDNTGLASSNVVGSGSDGTSYWSLFNIEGESSASAIYVTYATLADMLTDSNRTGEFVPDDTGLASSNVVGSGSDAVPISLLFSRLSSLVDGVGPGTSLADSVNAASAYFQAGDLQATCSALDDLSRKVNIFIGSNRPKIEPELAARLSADTATIQEAIGCQ